MLTVLVTLGVIVYGSVLHLQANFEKYEVRHRNFSCDDIAGWSPRVSRSSLKMHPGIP